MPDWKYERHELHDDGVTNIPDDFEVVAHEPNGETIVIWVRTQVELDEEQ